MDDTGSEGQVTASAAATYERFFVPALFGEWAPRVADAAGVAEARSVLDVACGTGVLAREAARRTAPGRVVGLDRNEAMLAVARRVEPAIEWRPGRAESLPFPEARFDVVVSQFGLMFFEDREASLREMGRVLRPGGRMAVAVFGSLDRTPGYTAMVALLRRLFGDEIADELRAPYALGDARALRNLFHAAGILDVHVEAVPGHARFPSIADWVHTEIRGWTLADRLDDERFAVLAREAEDALADLADPTGRVAFAHPALVVTASKT